MRRPLLVLLCPLLLLTLLVSACGGGSEGEAEDKGLPSVSGDYGDKPKVKKPAKGEKPGKKTTSEVLEEGDGKEVAKGDLLVADYLGQVYSSGKVFDNSYDRGTPAAFPIGTGQVIPGWDKILVGTKAGSRVLMVVAPKDGYGKTGNPQAGIKGTDSLVFVVDIIASYGKDTAGDGKAAAVKAPKGLPTVAGEPGARPKVTVPKGLAPPKKNAVTVLAKGTGEPVAAKKLAVVQYDAVNWASKPLANSWDTGPQGVPVAGEQPSPFDLLKGVPVGSRVLMTLTAQKGQNAKKESVAVVVDVLSQHGPAKEAE